MAKTMQRREARVNRNDKNWERLKIKDAKKLFGEEGN